MTMIKWKESVHIDDIFNSSKNWGEITAFKVTKNPQWFEGATKKMWFNDDNGGRKMNIEELHIK